MTPRDAFAILVLGLALAGCATQRPTVAPAPPPPPVLSQEAQALCQRDLGLVRVLRGVGHMTVDTCGKPDLPTLLAWNEAWY
jgi:hypothetical protein